jgi:Tol biopolymer transport system component
VVSPDGSTAALAFADTSGGLDLIDMRSGDQVRIAQSAAQVAPVWSLDGRYLFFVNDNTGALTALDRSTQTLTELMTHATQIESLAVRPTP